MQKLFAEPSEPATPWITRVLPRIASLVERKAEQTIFTRFIPAARVGQGTGTWKRYHERWASMTMEAVGPEMVELLPPLPAFTPLAKIIDKHIYSPWPEGRLQSELAGRRIDTLVTTGAKPMSAFSRPFLARSISGMVVLVTDALCSSSDATHDALMTVYHQRFAQQVETAGMEAVLSAWN
ncbi:cysteine hydrolase family protein [Mesorhizobium japonicum]|uniref:Mlr9687 protein n=1 Tax=Mesorhizobium japonicum (strain LMG 29417 / CECT 9101 / MAFF 303099) TaxID=266835 RepID=Q98NY4_RHILO|nr:cysteine hydrolase family protein [Mesorhizobium japonicum]BAB54871.1 mlr9687 [Mesorhizobium japonicum MAFF 303099]